MYSRIGDVRIDLNVGVYPDIRQCSMVSNASARGALNTDRYNIRWLDLYYNAVTSHDGLRSYFWRYSCGALQQACNDPSTAYDL